MTAILGLLCIVAFFGLLYWVALFGLLYWLVWLFVPRRGKFLMTNEKDRLEESNSCGNHTQREEGGNP